MCNLSVMSRKTFIYKEIISLLNRRHFNILIFSVIVYVTDEGVCVCVNSVILLVKDNWTAWSRDISSGLISN